MFLRENSEFPPENFSYWYDKYKEWETWYSSDIGELFDYYEKRKGEYSKASIFWGRLDNDEKNLAVHLPLAADIAETSSNLLFSEIPKINYDKEIESGKRIDEFIEENGFYNILLQASEMAAVDGGIFLKLDIDTNILNTPIISVLTPRQVIPTFTRGFLTSVLFHRTVKVVKDKNIVYRLFEDRTNINNQLKIEYKLYKGSCEKVGKIVKLNSIEETEILNLNDITINNYRGLGVIYIPNKLPNRLSPGCSIGINDYNGSINLLSNLDFSWSSWMRDIELGMGQIFIDQELLTREEANIYGTEKTVLNKFSKFQKSFIKLNLSNMQMTGDSKPIEVSQFEMRVEEHFKTCNSLSRQIVTRCGYSESSFGFDESSGQAESGTALRMRERKSLLTREKKSKYWQPAIRNLLIQMQQFDNALLNKSYEINKEITIELEDSIIVDSKEMSTTIKDLDQARSISTELKVRMLHPDWADDEIEAEVKRIEDQEGIEKTSDIFNVES